MWVEIDQKLVVQVWCEQLQRAWQNNLEEMRVCPSLIWQRRTSTSRRRTEQGASYEQELDLLDPGAELSGYSWGSRIQEESVELRSELRSAH